MMPIVRIRLCDMLVRIGAVCAFLATMPLSLGQQQDLPSHGIPYRRVFIPSKDLVHIGLDDFNPIDVKQLEELIQRRSNSRQSDATSDIASDTLGKIQLHSTYYLAKLVGPDLVSERSQLTLAGSPRPGERVSLRPWSLAVQAPTTPGSWIFDEQGVPRIATMPSDQVMGEGEFHSGKFSYPFGWSARAESTSTPNNLKFAFEIPKCANSCLVLALPPQAVVQDCLTVARRLEEWSEVELRLTGWSDVDKEYLRERSSSRSPESLWLIELGGSQNASFSIALGVGARPQDDTNASDAHRYRQLIRFQSLEHFVDGQEIRTTCEAEVFASPDQPWLRMSLEPGSRLRRLTVNQQDVDWILDDGWIQWSMGPAMKGASSTNSVSVVAEFISPLSVEKLEKTETPRVSFDHGYVMSGTTVVHSVHPWRLTNVECEASRIAEPTGDSKSTGINRLEYSWYARPPSLSIGLERSTQTRRCEVLTRLTNDEQGTLAVIRAKLFFAEQDSNQTKLAIAPGWSVRSIHSIDPTDSVTTQYDVESIGSASELRLSWDRVQRSRVAELEIRLYRNAEESPGQQRRIKNREIFYLPDWKRSDTFVLEDSGLFELRLCDELLDDLVTDELIPDWQKSLLPRIGKYYAFMKTTQERESIAALPELVWDTKPNRRQASTKTEIDRISSTVLQARHEIQLSLSSNQNEIVSIELPSDNVIWRSKEGSKWIPLSPLASSPALRNLGSSLWQFDLGQMAPECTLLAVVHSELQDDSAVRFSIPKLINADLLTQEARSLAKDVSIESGTVYSTWSIDEAGYTFLQFNDASADSNIVLTAKVSTPSPLRKWFVLASEYHVAVDTFGSQKASLYLRSNGTNHSPFVMELDNEWEPLTVGIRRSSIVQKIPFRIDGRRLIISPEQRDLEGEVELTIDLAGPRLSKKSSIRTMGEYFPFRWPDFTLDATCVSQQRFLWMPIEMQLAEWENEPGVPGQGVWPIWNWSRDVLASLFGYSRYQDSVFSVKDSGLSGDLVPQWAANGWRATRITSQALDTGSSVGTKSDAGVFRIHRVDSDRSYLVCLFAFVALLTPRLIMLRYHAAALVAAILIVCAHAAPLVAARFAYTGLIGMSASFVALILYRLLCVPVNGDKSASLRHSAKWSPWNDRVGDNESGSNHSQEKQIDRPRTSADHLGSLGLCLMIGWGVSSEYSPFSLMAFGQEKSDAEGTVYQVVIPMDEEGNMSGTTAYIPVEMLDVLTGKSERSWQTERGTHTVSAKYSLQIGVRGRFNSADQITMVYEFLVGEDLAPVRFPINALQLQLARFSVDGNELNLGNKLRSTGFEWIWTPEKPGKRSVQIIAQPLLKFNESDRNRESTAQYLDIAILPVANAMMEIETDPKNSLEIISRGQVTDPAGGRFVAMLGAVDRLQCTLTVPIAKSSSAFNNPATSVSESGDAPVMHTELFLQNDILQAKTILDFPKGIPVGREIEIEADQQWLPVGTQWGDAVWVESRSGTTLSRRRYVLEWKSPTGNSNPSTLSTRDRQISVIWVPQSANQSLNVLFAECRDRRTRRGTLRYSRAPGANWSIEGISTWSLAIGSKERLDWPELKSNPLATALRIPSTGGFGVLKPKLQADKQQQARVTTKWIVDPHRQSLTSRIELLGGSSTAEPLVVDMAEDFTVTDFYNGNGPIRYLQSRSNGKLHLQVLADRKSLEVSILWIQAKRLESNQAGLSANEVSANEEWLELPWIALPSTVNSDQTMEIVASEDMAIRLESESTLIFGKGLNAPALNLAKSYSDIHSITLAGSRYQMVHRNEPLVGSLTLKTNSTSIAREIDAVAQLSNSVLSRPFFILEVPASLKDRWQSEARMNLIPCPDTSKAWLQVSLPEPSELAAKTPVSTLVRFVPRFDEPASDTELMSAIRALDRERIPTQREDAATTDETNKAMGLRSKDTPLDRTTLGFSVAKCILRVRNDHFAVTPTARFALLESQYWIETTESTSANGILEWQLGEHAEVLSIDVNGQQVDFKQEGQRVHCSVIQAGLCSDVKVFSLHQTDTRTMGEEKIDAPKLMGITENVDTVRLDGQRLGLMLNGQSIDAMPPSLAIGAIANTCLRILEDSEGRWPNAAKFESGSDFDQWKSYWNQKAYGYLEEWSNSVGAEEQKAFGLAVKRWHSLQRFVRSSPREESVIPRSNRSHTLGDSVNAFVERAAPASPSDFARANPWYSLLGCLLILASLTWLTPPFVATLLARPWWCLMALGLFAWLVSGSLLPALIFGSIGLIVAADSYWLVTSRLRRSGIRGPRSL